MNESDVDAADPVPSDDVPDGFDNITELMLNQYWVGCHNVKLKTAEVPPGRQIESDNMVFLAISGSF